MSWTEKFSLIVVTAVFSLVGGAAAEHFWPGAVPQLGAASVTKNVPARQFTLVDKDGATRALLDVTGKGVAELRLLDDTGKLRAGLGVAHDGGGSATWNVAVAAKPIVGPAFVLAIVTVPEKRWSASAPASTIPASVAGPPSGIAAAQTVEHAERPPGARAATVRTAASPRTVGTCPGGARAATA